MISKEFKKKYDEEYRKKNKEKMSIYAKEYYKNNKEEICKRIKEYRKNNPNCENKEKRNLRSKRYRNKNSFKSRSSIWRNRGIKITEEEYNNIYKEQKGCCAICGVPEQDTGIKLCLDHNHNNGEVRGLLCRRCNSAIGMLEIDNKDVIYLLLKSVEYIKKYGNYLDCERRK